MNPNSIETRIIGWIENTNNKTLSWEATSLVTMFMVRDEGKIFSIEKVENEKYEISEWDSEGNVVSTITSNGEKLKQLYDNIVTLNLTSVKRLSEKYLEPVSLWKIMHQLGFENDEANEIIEIGKNESFYYVTKDDSNYNENYVEPPFVRIDTFNKPVPLNEADVILISAPGATGKSALSAYLSNRMGIPLFDLSKHNAVASHSLFGLFIDNLTTEDFTHFKDGLSHSKFSMIIDGLDEGEIRAGSTVAYENFLDDVVKIAKKAEGTPFIMLGRYQTVMDTAFYLECNDVRVLCLQIEPFTLRQAEDFIDKVMENRNSAIRFEQSFRDVRRFIINQIEGFFRGDGDVKKQSFSRFIGYAPVLMAIAALLDERKDYNKLLQELKDEQKTNIDLVISIIEKILYREQGKVRDNALPQILENYDKQFSSEIIEQTYGIEEQCARLLHYVLHKDYIHSISDKEGFNHIYNEKMEECLKNHPFLDPRGMGNPQIQNIVFESYIVARLAHESRYIEVILEYLSKSKGGSYLLFDFYDKLSGEDRKLDYRLIAYLFDSYRALDTASEMSSMELISTTLEEEFLEAHCELTFYREGQTEDSDKEFETDIPYDGVLSLPSLLRGLNVDIPLPVVCNTPRLDIKPPMNIHCTEMRITSGDIVISSNGSNDTALISCGSFTALQNSGNIPHVKNRVDNTDTKILVIRSNNRAEYPFSEYWKANTIVSRDDRDIVDKYNKLCRTIILFRSFGKESMARIQDKIHCRICNTKIGKAVVDKLISSRIIYKQGIMYVLNIDEMNRQLGMSYNDIHSGEINEKTRAFLKNTIVGN